MINGKKVLAVIPARGGSKGLPGKNIRPLCGKPLIAWTIEQAEACSLIDTIFVSTDSPEIAAVSEQYGVPVPFLRPAALSTDTATSVDVLLHVLACLEVEQKYFDYIILLEPTSPLRRSEDITEALAALASSEKAESIVGVCKTEGQNPAFLVTLSQGFLRPFSGEFVDGVVPAVRRQDAQDVYFFEGSLYISLVSSLKKRKSFYHEKTLPWTVEKWQSFEIDDEYDFHIVESIMQYKGKI